MKTVAGLQIKMLLDLETLCRDDKKGVRKDVETVQAATARIDSKISHLQAFKRPLYERFKNGALDRAAFLTEREAVEADIRKKTAERDILLAGNDEQTDAFNSIQPFLSSFQKYQTLPALPDDVINEWVEAVYIFDPDKIEVRFSFKDELEQAIGVWKGMA